jgi:hypothetical protein
MSTPPVGHVEDGGRSNGAIGGVAAILTLVGLSGVGDAPAPLEDARSMADHFQAVRTDVFIGAALGMVGVAALVGFVGAFASRLMRAGERAAGIAIGAGLAVVVGYLLVLHTVYTTLSYGIAVASDDVTKGMFVATVLAVPVVGLGVATLLLAAAIGSWRADLMPRSWRAATLAGGTISTISVFSYADAGFFSPDVQQQVVAYTLVLWLAGTAVACAIRRSGPDRDAAPEPASGTPVR